MGATGTIRSPPGDNDDNVRGEGGDDTINGGGGDDFLRTEELCGGGFPSASSPNEVDAGTGDDLVFGGDDADSIDGGDGDDTVAAGAGADSVDLGIGRDGVCAGPGRIR